MVKVRTDDGVGEGGGGSPGRLRLREMRDGAGGVRSMD